jgi:hypothetical protein
VHKIVAGRAVLGEYQPISKGKKDGDPIPDYYPAAIDEATWNQAKDVLKRRKKRTGRVGEKVPSLFSGLLHEALNHDSLRVAWQGRTKHRVLVNARSMDGAAPLVSFPNDIFEAAILSLLREVNPADVLGKQPKSELAAVNAEVAGLEQQSRRVEAEMIEGGDVPALARVLRELHERLKRARKRQAEIRQQEANPRGVAWAEAQTLLDVAKDEPTRLRLREKLRAIISEIWVLIVPRRPHRLAIIQVFFEGDGRRDYLIHYRSAAFSCKGGWCACSLPSEIAPGDLDLRRKPDAEELMNMLSAVDIGLLVNAMKGGGK